MAIFTSGQFLFSSVLQEKTNRVIEILLSYASSRQIMAGKIFGLGFLGLMQVLIWLSITSIFVFFNLFQAGQISSICGYFCCYWCHILLRTGSATGKHYAKNDCSPTGTSGISVS
jgi:ABC-type Na+ efflux pump permease subunit